MYGIVYIFYLYINVTDCVYLSAMWFLCSILFFILTLMDICSFSLFTFNCYIVFLVWLYLFFSFLFTDRITDRLFPIIFYYKEGCIKKSLFMSSCACYMLSVAIIHFCYSSMKIAMEMIWVWLHFNKTLQKQAVGRNWVPTISYTGIPWRYCRFSSRPLQ